jgi:hypothetical protein
VALALAVRAARALDAAAQRGVGHGRLHPGNVVLTPGGRLTLLDLGTAAVLHEGSDSPPAPAGPRVSPSARDTRDLAALLYAMLTARWPAGATDQLSGGLPPAPVRDGRPRRARRLNGAVPRALDDLLAGALAGGGAGTGPQTPGELARALARVETDQSAPPVGAARKPRLPPGVRRRLPVLLVSAFLVAVGVSSYLAGQVVGAVEPPQDALEALVEPSTAPATDPAAAGAPIDLLTSAQVRDFDPPPGDGREGPGTVPNAYDGDASTAWQTERYSSAPLGGLKQGVGLLVDLGTPTPVARVELGVPPGTGVELRSADEAGAALSDFAVVETAQDTGEVVALEAGRTARYWLVLLTRLPPEPGGFRGQVAEMRFLRG